MTLRVLGRAKEFPLDRENRRSAGLAGFDRAMGLGGVLEWESLPDLDLHLAADDGLEEICCGSMELGRGCRVLVHPWPGEEERTLLRKDCDREGVDRLHEGLTPDAVIDDRQLFTAGDPLDFCDEILARVDDRMVAAMGAGELR